MAGMSRMTQRIKDWESLFHKYENVDSHKVFHIRINSWQPVQEEDKEEDFPKDIKKRVDSLWENDSSDLLRYLEVKKVGNDPQHTHGRRNSDSHRSAKNEELTPESFPADDDDDDDDYYNYESSLDMDDAQRVPVSRKEFVAALHETSMTRIREMKRSRNGFKQRDTKPRSPKIDDCTPASISVPHRKSQKSLCRKKAFFKKVSSCAKKCSNRSENNSWTKTKETNDKNLTSDEPSFGKCLSRLEIDSSSRNQPKTARSREAIPVITGTSPLRENNTLKTDKTETFTMSPVDKKQKILSPGKNCDRSPKLPLRVCLVDLSQRNELFTANHEMTRADITSPPHLETSCSMSRISVLAAPSSKAGASELSPKLSDPSRSSGKTISLKSSTLRSKVNSERTAYRAFMKGRSLFDI